MVYRDMTFCRAKDCAKFQGCPRAYTAAVAALAKACGQSVSQVAKRSCYEPKGKENGPAAKAIADSD